MKRLLFLVALQTSAACATLHLPPPEDDARFVTATGHAVPVPGVMLAAADVGATASDWYERLAMGQFIDPFRPTFITVRVTGNVTANAFKATQDSGSYAFFLKTGNYINFNDGTNTALLSHSVAVGGIGTALALFSSIASGGNAFTTVNEGARVGTGPDTDIEEQGTRIRARQGIDGTAGSGTGITTNQTSAIAHQVHRQTIINTALTAAPTTDITVWTTPVNTRIVRIIALVTQVFTGGALSAVTLSCGNAAGGAQYLIATSVLAAQTTIGDVNAEVGLNLIPGNAAFADMGTPAAGVPGAIAISCRFTCTGANCNAATQGSVSLEIEHVVYP